MAGGIRVISFDELRDAIEHICVLNVTEHELAAHGIQLSGDEVLIDGLGPSKYSVVELEDGHQFLLHRLVKAPFEGVNIEATLTGPVDELCEELLHALDLPESRMQWPVPAEQWQEMVVAYRGDGRDRWSSRAGRGSGAGDG